MGLIVLMFKYINNFNSYKIYPNGIIVGPYNKPLRYYSDKDGYLYCYLYKNGKRKKQRVHRLIAQHFISSLDNKPCVNHKNGIKIDNRVKNLEWVTIAENNKHAWKLGLNKSTKKSRKMQSLSGKKNRKLTFAMAEKIRELYACSDHNTVSLGKLYGVSYRTISDIVRYKKYMEA